MNRVFVVACAVALALAGAQPMLAAPELFELAFNIDGTITHDDTPPLSAPPSVNSAGFNFTTGLGTLVLTLNTAGPHSVIAWLNHDFDAAVNTYFNEFGTLFGAPGLDETWEVDEPGYSGFGNIFANVSLGVLDNTNAVPGPGLDDVSLALGHKFSLMAGQTAQIQYQVSQTAPGGFYLRQTDGDTNESIYFSSNVRIAGGPGPAIPEPGTSFLMASGLAILLYRTARRSRRS